MFLSLVIGRFKYYLRSKYSKNNKNLKNKLNFYNLINLSNILLMTNYNTKIPRYAAIWISTDFCNHCQHLKQW
jgi:hypothetical protein